MYLTSLRFNFVIVDIEAGVGIHFHQPYTELVINQNIKSQYLKAFSRFLISVYKAIVCISQIWLKSNYSFGSQIVYLSFENFDVSALFRDFLKYLGK